MRDVYFTVGKQKIKATLFFPKKMRQQNPGIIFIHGWGSNEKNYVKRAEALSEKGAICLTFDLRGQGASEGKFEDFSRADHLEDAIAAFDFLISQKNVDLQRVGACGVSYGAYLGAILTSKRNLRWLAMRVPALYRDDDFSIPTAELIEKDPKVFTQSGIKPQNNFALQAIAKFSGSVLLVESEKDDIISHATIENYLEALKNKEYTYKVMKNADHGIFKPEFDSQFIKILSLWFETQLKKY